MLGVAACGLTSDKAAKVDCSKPLAKPRQVMLPHRVWDPPAVAVLGKGEGCSTQRVDIYDLDTRTLTSSTELPPESTDWRLWADELHGNYMSLWSNSASRSLMLHVPSGRIAYDSKNFAEQFPSARTRLFERPLGHVFGWGDDLLLELNDATVVKLDLENNTLEPEDKRAMTLASDYGRHMNESAGCPGSGREADAFREEPRPGWESGDFVDLSGVEFGVSRVVFDRDQTTTLRFIGTDVGFETEPLFHPTIFVPFVCRSRPLVPILVLHRAHLDYKTAEHLLSRLDGSGSMQWTVKLPGNPSHPRVRQLGDVLVLAASDQVIWVDLSKGEVLHDM